MAAVHEENHILAAAMPKTAGAAVRAAVGRVKAEANEAAGKPAFRADRHGHALAVEEEGQMTNQDPNRVVPDKLEYGKTQPPRNDIKEQRGGPQDNQITGQTEEGAHNQEMQGRNPQGNKPDEWKR